MRRTLSANTLSVLELLADGLTNKEIAARLGLAESTIKWHVSKLLASYGSANRAHLVRVALARGALSPQPEAGLDDSVGHVRERPNV